MGINLDSGYGLRVLAGPSGLRPLFQHNDGLPGFGQVGGQGHAVWPTTHDDKIVSLVSRHTSLLSSRFCACCVVLAEKSNVSENQAKLDRQPPFLGSPPRLDRVASRDCIDDSPLYLASRQTSYRFGDSDWPPWFLVSSKKRITNP